MLLPWIALLIYLVLPASNLSAQNRRIAIFGSSVANASGDNTAAGGFAGSPTRQPDKRDWEVVYISRGGDNTTTILLRYETQLLPQKPKYVIIGLSPGNEGIANPPELARNRSFEKYRSGLFNLVQLCRKIPSIPIQ